MHTVVDHQSVYAVSGNVSTGNALKTTAETYVATGQDSGFRKTVKNVADETGNNKKLISAGATDFGDAANSAMLKRLNINRDAQYKLHAGFNLSKTPVIGFGHDKLIRITMPEIRINKY